MINLASKTDEIAQAQITEALLRMKKLDIHENAINEFLRERKLNLSEPGFGNKVGVLYWLNDDEQKMIEEWEQETGNVVYHVIKNNTQFGLCYSFLYVSSDPEEWLMDNADLEEGYPFVYVKNVTDDWCSEYGRIGIQSAFGGVVRIS